MKLETSCYCNLKSMIFKFFIVGYLLLNFESYNIPGKVVSDTSGPTKTMIE